MSDRSRLAIDIVLLPSQEIAETAIKINAGLRAKKTDEIELSLTDRMPHITLAMGSVGEDDLNLLLKKTARIAKSSEPIYVRSAPNKSGKAWMTIQITPELERLHEDILGATADIISSDADASMFLIQPGRTVSDSTLTYMRNFKPCSSYGKYSPHITVGVNDAAVKYDPFGFKARKLYVVHMGDHCTAGKILYDCMIGG